MSEIHMMLHGGAVEFDKIKQIVASIEALGYKAEMVDNGTIVFNVEEIVDAD